MKEKESKKTKTIIKTLMVSQFAKLLGRQAQTIRVWEKKGLIPPPTLVGEAKVTVTSKTPDNSGNIAGNRLYTVFLLKEVYPIVRTLQRGRKVAAFQKSSLLAAFAKEREELLRLINNEDIEIEYSTSTNAEVEQLKLELRNS